MSVNKYIKYILNYAKANYFHVGYLYIFYFDISDLAEEKDGDVGGVKHAYNQNGSTMGG
jgi:hypothetical protein